MKPYYEDERVTLYHGDCLDVLRSLPDASVDAVCTDPPYGLEFMGKAWDSFPLRDRGVRLTGSGNPTEARGFGGNVAYGQSTAASRAFGDWCELWATECLRVLKPGGHMLAFGGTRTWHRLACAVEDAGFEVRDSIAWLYGSGFPKSLDVSKAIDKAAGATREVVGVRTYPTQPNGRSGLHQGYRPGEMQGTEVNNVLTAPATPDAERWQGWGTALKPAFEPVVVARKPLQGTVAANVLAHGTGALNIDATRVNSHSDGPGTTPRSSVDGRRESMAGAMDRVDYDGSKGRWPTNVVLDETQAAALDEMSGETVSKAGGSSGTHFSAGDPGVPTPDRPRGGHTDSGGASRFFPTFRYEAKAPATERPRVDGTAHPTVKPLDLMRWLVRLVTPPGGVVLEPFAGSGTTVEACIVEGFRCIAIEREADYLPLILQRIHRRRDPVAAIRQTGDDLGLFELDGESA